VLGSSFACIMKCQRRSCCAWELIINPLTPATTAALQRCPTEVIAPHTSGALHAGARPAVQHGCRHGGHLRLHLAHALPELTWHCNSVLLTVPAPAGSRTLATSFHQTLQLKQSPT
jgi:hypothetical protein